MEEKLNKFLNDPRWNVFYEVTCVFLWFIALCLAFRMVYIIISLYGTNTL